MSKGKKGKSVLDSVNWDENLLKEPLKNDTWQPFIFMAVPEQASSEPTLHSLVSAVKTGCRRKFTVLSKEDMLLSAKDDAKLASASAGGGRKSKQSTATNKPLFVEVCEHVVNAMNVGDVPHSLLARLLKYNIIKKRTADMAAKEGLQEKEDTAKSKSASAKGKGGGGRVSKKGKATPANGNDPEEMPMPVKPPTTMKKRGEEDQESKYIDDEPQNGPSAYIFLHGFNEVEIFSHLSEVGIVIHALIKVTNAATETLECNAEDEEYQERQTISLAKFWHDVDMMYFSDNSILQDTANLDMKTNTLPPSSPDSDENKQFGLSIFSELSAQLYRILESQKQYQHYLNYLDIKDVKPFEDVSCTLNGKKETMDMRYYNEQLNNIPTEFVTPTVILQCMLNQVEFSLSDNNNMSSLPDCLHQDLHKAMSNIISMLPVKSTYEGNDNKCINVFNELDKASISSFNVSQLISANILYQKHSLVALAINTPSSFSSAEERLLHDAQLHALSQFTTDLPSLYLDALLGISSLEYVSPPSNNDEPSHQFTVTSNLLFDYPLNIPFEIPKTSTDIVPPIAVNSDAQSSLPLTPVLNLPDQFSDLSEYCVLEPLNRDVLLQVIQSHQTSHPYIKFHHHKLSNSLIAAMYSGYNNSLQRVGKYTWQIHIHSKVGFSNYLKYIAEKVGLAVNNAVKEDNESRLAIEVEQAKALENKMKELHEAQKQEVDTAKSGKSGKKSNSGKKTSSGKTSKLEMPTVTEEAAADSNIPPSVERKLYTGYDIGSEVLICDGTLAKAFTNDGICIKSEKIQFVNHPISFSVSLEHNDITLSAVITRDTTPIMFEGNTEQLHDNTSIQPPKTIIYSAFQANLENVVRLSFSKYGVHGNGQLPVQPFSEKELAKLTQIQAESPSQPSSRPSSQDKKLSKKQQEDQQRAQEQQQVLEAKLAESKDHLLNKIKLEKESILRCNKYQQLNLTTLNDLHVTCSTMETSTSQSSVIITQQYNSPPAYFGKEVQRVYFHDGSVMKKGSDGCKTIYCCDGKIFETIHNTSKEKEKLESAFSDANKVQSKTKVTFTTQETPENNKEKLCHDDLWVVTFPDGSKQIMKYVLEQSLPVEGDEQSPKEDWVVRTAPLDSISTYVLTDPKSNEVLITREDNVIILKKPDESTVVEHADGTRITSLPLSSLLIIEHPLFATTTYSNRQCIVNLSPEINITCKLNGEYNLSHNFGKYNLAIDCNGDMQYSSRDSGTYNINHASSSYILSATDTAFVNYTVNTDGEIHANNNNTESKIPVSFQPHFFIIPTDGHCYEIHHKTKLNGILSAFQQLAEVVVRSEQLDQHSQNCLTTFILPVSNEEKVLYPYQQESIIPANLQALKRLHSITTNCTAAKPFGIGVGRALDIGVYKSPKPMQSFTQPRLLKYRHFIQLDESFREKMKSSLTKYLTWREEKDTTEEQVLPPQNKRKEVSEHLNMSILSFKGMSSPEALLSHYKSSIENHSLSCSPTQKKVSQFADKIKTLNNDIKDAEVMKNSIKQALFPPYFQSKDGVDFLHSNKCSSPKKQSHTISYEHLSTDALSLKFSEDFTPMSAVPNSLFDPDASEQFSSTNSFTKIRPANPTPTHAQGNGSPSPIRPTNGISSEEVPMTTKEMAFFDKLPSAPNPVTTPALYYQLSGELRPTPVQLPRSISGSRPGEKPNIKYLEVEEQVRRKVHTSSTSQVAVIRGFEVFPPAINFGILKEGCTYSVECTLKNIGIDTCRFKFKNPPPSTGIKIYYTPGSVVAGMSRKFQVEIFALAVGASSHNEMGMVYHELEIDSESNMLRLPIQAYIYPLDLFNQHYDHDLAGTKPTTVLVSNRSVSRQNFKRPHH